MAYPVQIKHRGNAGNADISPATRAWFGAEPDAADHIWQAARHVRSSTATRSPPDICGLHFARRRHHAQNLAGHHPSVRHCQNRPRTERKRRLPVLYGDHAHCRTRSWSRGVRHWLGATRMASSAALRAEPGHQSACPQRGIGNGCGRRLRPQGIALLLGELPEQADRRDDEKL